MHWEHFEHKADMGVRGIGPTPSAAFAQATRALTAIICDPASIRLRTGVPIICQAPDLKSLLVDSLNAVIHDMATRRMLFGR